jgi:adenosylhomocysteine nucleosidase
MANKLAIFAALPQEADAFMAGEGEILTDAPFAIRDIGDIVIATCGIGKVNIAAAAMMLVARYQPSLLAMTGTCGRVSEIKGDTFWIEGAVQHDYGVVRTGSFAHYQGGEWPMGPEGHPPFLAIPDPGLNLPHARMRAPTMLQVWFYGSALIWSIWRSQPWRNWQPNLACLGLR